MAPLRVSPEYLELIKSAYFFVKRAREMEYDKDEANDIFTLVWDIIESPIITDVAELLVMIRLDDLNAEYQKEKERNDA